MGDPEPAALDVANAIEQVLHQSRVVTEFFSRRSINASNRNQPIPTRAVDKQRARSALRNDRGFRDRLVAKDRAIEVAQVCVDVVCAIVGNDQYGRSPRRPR